MPSPIMRVPADVTCIKLILVSLYSRCLMLSRPKADTLLPDPILLTYTCAHFLPKLDNSFRQLAGR